MKIIELPHGREPRCTALFLFRNTADPLSRLHLHAMWHAFRYYLTQHPLRDPSNLQLMDHVSCADEDQARMFESRGFAAVLRAVKGNIPERVQCFVPDAELLLVQDSPAEVLGRLKQGWLPHSTLEPKKPSPVAVMAKKAGAG
ncbi:MAG: hypothetical protein COT92_01285 [Candidatus Doudnabacteria bacterium CG10_big_fil_rev_8_21_14_0_10_42_18]|uniref:Uncharacterized protein n=1 Tax=Candidatus Doudnabacteria bacterium CG10_big_fil_rev_8_21_14_0_10_42_18 TaxID=1974552 RepID=A0A2H0VDI5_9BACT|nr:MAG: hypothetical protein COT92_01285 [Candidatus Doudnabacteria bacterium CG10_big_fil_rev_8_21_14_0_10_42_18]